MLRWTGGTRSRADAGLASLPKRPQKERNWIRNSQVQPQPQQQHQQRQPTGCEADICSKTFQDPLGDVLSAQRVPSSSSFDVVGLHLALKSDDIPLRTKPPAVVPKPNETTRVEPHLTKKRLRSGEEDERPTELHDTDFQRRNGVGRQPSALSELDCVELCSPLVPTRPNHSDTHVASRKWVLDMPLVAIQYRQQPLTDDNLYPQVGAPLWASSMYSSCLPYEDGFHTVEQVRHGGERFGAALGGDCFTFSPYVVRAGDVPLSPFSLTSSMFFSPFSSSQTSAQGGAVMRVDNFLTDVHF